MQKKLIPIQLTILTLFGYILDKKVHSLQARTGEVTVLDHPAQRRRVVPPINMCCTVFILALNLLLFSQSELLLFHWPNVRYYFYGRCCLIHSALPNLFSQAVHNAGHLSMKSQVSKETVLLCHWGNKR